MFDQQEAHRDAILKDEREQRERENEHGWMGEERNAPSNLSPVLLAIQQKQADYVADLRARNQ